MEDVDPGVDDADHHSAPRESGGNGGDVGGERGARATAFVAGRRRVDARRVGVRRDDARGLGRRRLGPPGPGRTAAVDGDHAVERGDPFEVLGGDRAGRDPGGAELGPEPGLLHHLEVAGVVEQDLDPLCPVQPGIVVLDLAEGGLPECVNTRDQRFVEFCVRHSPPRSRPSDAIYHGPAKICCQSIFGFIHLVRSGSSPASGGSVCELISSRRLLISLVRINGMIVGSE